ncbi:dihydroneopterin aldolase [bacterium]|nr:dihydroneopterin aldolase [bacterium]
MSPSDKIPLPRDKIVICDLELETQIGTTPAEQAQPQRLLISVELERDLSLAGRTDQASATTDYEAVAVLVRNLVSERPRKLIEAIADELAEAILSRRLADRVTIEVKKFSIPNTQYVGVRITRTQ